MQIKKSFLVLAAFCLGFTANQAQAALTNGLVAYWALDTTDSVTTPDLALGNNMQLVNSPTLATGVRGNCFNFTGTQYLQVFHSTNSAATGLPIYTTNGYTIGFWVQGKSSQTANSIPFSEVSYAGSMLLDFNLSNTKIRVFLRINSGATAINNVASSAVVFDTAGATWHHIAFTDLNGTCKLYIDGNLDSANVNYTIPSAGAPAATVTTIGALVRLSPPVGNQFKGAVDEVMGWNRVLSQAEIQDAMNNGIPQPILATPPQFLSQPTSSTNAMGDQVILSANAFGNQPMTYQWYSNSVALAGQTTNSLELTTLVAPGAATYSLIASNIAGTNVSLPAVVTVLPDAPPTNIDAGLIGYWPLDSVSNSISTPDLVSQNDFQLVNNPLLTSGEFSGALSFDGASQYGVATNATPVYDASTTNSVAFWVKGTPQAGFHVIFGNGNPANGNYFLIGSDASGSATGKIEVKINPGTGNLISTATVLDNNWHHVAWVDQNGTAMLYVDGVLDQTVYNYARSAVTVNNTTIGGLYRTNVADVLFAGTIDDVGTWNRRLSYSEIQSIIAHGIPAPPLVTKPTVGVPIISEAAVYQGDSITITAAVSGTTPSSQWYFGSNAISGVGNPSALTPTLSLASVTPAQSGTYTLVATNSAGAASNSIVLTVIPYIPATNGDVLKVEFNSVVGANVQAGFSSMTLAQNPATFSGPTIAVSTIGSTGLQDRNRDGSIPTLTNNPPTMTTSNLYQQFIFSTANTAGTGLDARLTRLAPNTQFGITVWSWDRQNSGYSDWTITGVSGPVTFTYPLPAPAYLFSGPTIPNTDYSDTMGALVTSTTNGTLEIQATVDPFNTAVTVFFNAIEVVANPVIQITGATVAQDGNVQLTIKTQYPYQPISFVESPDLSPGSWQPAGDATVISTVGPIVTVEFPKSANQYFYQAVSMQ